MIDGYAPICYNADSQANDKQTSKGVTSTEKSEIYLHVLNAKNMLNLILTHIDFTQDEVLEAESIRFAVETAYKEAAAAEEGLAARTAA